ncbi:MAG TPA: feruloyl-CoA synthase, partial [Burkholderiales bacterium]
MNQPSDMRRTRSLRLAPAAVVAERRAGALYLRSPHALSDYPRTMTERLDEWARRTPERLFLAQRAPDGSWRRLTYG